MDKDLVTEGEIYTSREIEALGLTGTGQTFADLLIYRTTVKDTCSRGSVRTGSGCTANTASGRLQKNKAKGDDLWRP